MTITTDLTFDQLKAAMIANGVNASAISVVNAKVIIDVGLILGTNTVSLASPGVVKLIAKLSDYCIEAQENFNQNKEDGEKLASFTVESDAVPDNGFVQVSHKVTAHYKLNSTTQIMGKIA